MPKPESVRYEAEVIVGGNAIDETQEGCDLRGPTTLTFQSVVMCEIEVDRHYVETVQVCQGPEDDMSHP